MPISPDCEAGCMSFDGGEVKHHRDCKHYPESLTKLWQDLEDDYIQKADQLRQMAIELHWMMQARIDGTGGTNHELVQMAKARELLNITT